jgi:cysteine desulfuration protein SufE
MTPEELAEEFTYLEDWEQRYAYIIDLGRGLAAMEPDQRVDAALVPGCLSRVWLHATVVHHDGRDELVLSADSDAHITKGLVAIALLLFNGQTPAEVLAVDLDGFFERLDLGGHVSVNRRNGFYSMIGRIRALAEAHVH